MRARKGRQIQQGARLVAVVLLALTCALPAVAAQEHHLANGITVRLHGADEIQADPSLLVEAPGGPYALAGDADGWYPVDASDVLDALASMRGFAVDVTVSVYILPAPPAAGGRSWSARDGIFLVPGFGPVAPATVAYITTHEMGHVLTWAYVDPHPARWSRYLGLRGVDGEPKTPEHAWQPREILAEDLRFLFGGALATAAGSIENRYLATPDQVPGLRELLAGFVGTPGGGAALASAYPNPCNPRTTLRMSLPADAVGTGDAEVRIYDVRGGLVRRLTGGRAVAGGVEISWDGRDRQGGSVASGRYLYVMTAAGLQARGAVTLVR